MIAFSGCEGGVGTSTLSFNFAATWADWSAAKTLYVTLDISGIERLAERAASPKSTTIFEIQKDHHRKGEIRVGPYDLGVLPFAGDASDLKALAPRFAGELLAELNATYDVILDLNLSRALRPASDGCRLIDLLNESDQVFWVTLPGKSMAEQDEAAIHSLRSLGIGLERFDLVANQIGREGLADYASLRPRAEALGAVHMFAVPFRLDFDSLPLANAAENPRLREAFLPMLYRVEGRAPRQPQRSTQAPMKFGSAVVAVGEENEEAAAIALSKKLGIPYASRENKILRMESGQDLERLIPEDFAHAHLVYPLFIEDGVLAIAMADPDSHELMQRLAERTKFQIQPFVASKSAILAAIGGEYAYQHARSEDARALGADARITTLVNAILKQAMAETATKIELARAGESTSLRFWIGDEMREGMAPPWLSFKAILLRLRGLCKLPQGGSAGTEEGSFSFKVQGKPHVARVKIIEGTQDAAVEILLS